jgi:zinc D-Ala-D-Ala carboxypeptidase
MLSDGIQKTLPVRDFEWRDRWPNFWPREFSCRHCGEYYHHERLLDKLQSLRFLIDKPLKINSGHRCEEHNKKVGGAKNSQHLTMAVDISLTGHDRWMMVNLAKSLGFTGIGYGATFLHLDLREKPAEWFYPDSKQYWPAPD